MMWEKARYGDYKILFQISCEIDICAHENEKTPAVRTSQFHLSGKT